MFRVDRLSCAAEQTRTWNSYYRRHSCPQARRSTTRRETPVCQAAMIKLRLGKKASMSIDHSSERSEFLLESPEIIYICTLPCHPLWRVAEVSPRWSSHMHWPAAAGRFGKIETKFTVAQQIKSLDALIPRVYLSEGCVGEFQSI